MYSTCIFCSQPLGANEVLESFPVGRRIAFDGATGRLWVVCRKCERWNLSALEERWEVIEACERLYSETRMRVSTENIGLARLPEGLELVRIGKPMRPEFAAWRYGDQFGRRRKRVMLRTGAAVAGIGVIYGGAAIAGLTIGGFIGFGGNFYNRIAYGPANAVVAHIRTSTSRIEVKRKDLRKVKLLGGLEDELFRIRIPDGKSSTVLTHEEAQRATALLLPAMNQAGGSAKQVKEAVEMLNREADPVAFISQMARGVESGGAVTSSTRLWSGGNRVRKDSLLALPLPIRLAMEMAAHEESERRSLEGELKALELAWKEAEEVAAISDDLFVPQSIRDMLAKFRLGG